MFLKEEVYMAKVLIGYFSRTGNTEKMANIIRESMMNEKNIEVICKKVGDISIDEILKYEGIVLGTPTYYGSMAWQIKRLLDESVKFHGELEGKVGAAFSSAANIGGGNETAVLDILHAFLIHGMVVKGYSGGDHYGAVSIGPPDDRVEEQCRKLAKEVAGLVRSLSR